MENEIYYKVEKIKKTPAGRVYCIKSNHGTVFEMLVSNEQFERFDIDEGEIIDDAHFLKIREEMLFDNARRAAFSILSCGENNMYNHPSPATLDAYKKSKILRTDLNDGPITFTLK